jgi:hypothetical protein
MQRMRSVRGGLPSPRREQLDGGTDNSSAAERSASLRSPGTVSRASLSGLDHLLQRQMLLVSARHFRRRLRPLATLTEREKVLSSVKYFSMSSSIGEPLLHPEWRQILEWLYRINPTVSVRVTTNGTALTAQKTAWFAQLKRPSPRLAAIPPERRTIDAVLIRKRPPAARYASRRAPAMAPAVACWASRRQRARHYERIVRWKSSAPTA